MQLLGCLKEKILNLPFLYVNDIPLNMQYDRSPQLLLITLEYKFYKCSFSHLQLMNEFGLQ